jgi:two-component system, sensor histidine kinase
MSAKSRVLVVDDERTVRAFTCRVLLDAGFDVLEADTGLGALRMAADGMDLIVLDVKLPDISGVEVCRRLKQDARLLSLPVLMMSGHFIESDEKSEGLEIGADAYLTKPVAARELRATVNALLRMRRAEAELHRSELHVQAQERLVADVMKAARVKEDFLVSVSHELGTPLTAIKALVDTLCADPKLDLGTRKEFFGVLQDEVNRLGRLVMNILDASRLEMGRFDVRLTPLDLRPLVARVVREIQARRRPITYEPGAALPIHGDRDRLTQVLVNLVDNAIKFSPLDAPILVRATAESGWAVVRLFDRGPGVSPAMEAKLFEKFGRLERPGVSSTHGVGLGLYLSSEIVRAHGGTLGLERHPGWAAVFAIRIPLKEEPA